MKNLRVIQGGKREILEHSFQIGPEELLHGDIYLKHVCECLGVEISDLHRRRLVTHLFQVLGLYVSSADIDCKHRDAEKCGTGGTFDRQGQAV